jgi:hypothetical protein
MPFSSTILVQRSCPTFWKRVNASEKQEPSPNVTQA